MALRRAAKTDIKSACRTCARCVFCQLPDDEWRRIDSRAPRYYRAGVILFEQGDYPDGIHLICGGSLKQWKSDHKGRRFLWRVIETGDVLGAITLLNGRPYPTTVETTEPCLIRFIPKKLFFQMLDEHRAILLLRTGSRLYDTLDLLREFALSGSALERLALLLYRLWAQKDRLKVGTDLSVYPLRAEKQGRGTEGRSVRIHLSREEMAERIGVEAPETVSGLLGELVKRGAIERDRGVTVIINPDLLKSIG